MGKKGSNPPPPTATRPKPPPPPAAKTGVQERNRPSKESVIADLGCLSGEDLNDVQKAAEWLSSTKSTGTSDTLTVDQRLFYKSMIQSLRNYRAPLPTGVADLWPPRGVKGFKRDRFFKAYDNIQLFRKQRLPSIVPKHHSALYVCLCDMACSWMLSGKDNKAVMRLNFLFGKLKNSYDLDAQISYQMEVLRDEVASSLSKRVPMSLPRLVESLLHLHAVIEHNLPGYDSNQTSLDFAFSTMVKRYAQPDD